VATYLGGVSCPSTTACTTVGSTLKLNHRGGIFRYQAVAERWNGKRWSIQRIPFPEGAFETHLRGVSCASRTTCTAVGTLITATGGYGNWLPMVERWNSRS
jgi:hypothetical protein